MNERKRKTKENFFHNRAGFLMERKKKQPTRKAVWPACKTFLSLFSPPRWLDRLILFYLISFSIIYLAFSHFFHSVFYYVCSTPKRNFTRARSRTDNCHLAGCCCCVVLFCFLPLARPTRRVATGSQSSKTRYRFDKFSDSSRLFLLAALNM